MVGKFVNRPYAGP